MENSIFRAAHTLLMGIVNVTPDSFSDGGRYFSPDSAIRHARALVEDGADILDVGGESTRPASEPVTAREELRRVLPVIEALVKDGAAAISIDTTKPEVADACLQTGARIVNDISGLRDTAMREVAARHGASVVIMHMQGTPQTMQLAPRYHDVVHEIAAYLKTQAALAREAGIRDIAIDPGIGFGKTVAHNLEILGRLREFAALGYPLLLGPSRKSFLGKVPGAAVDEKRLEGTIAACVVAALNGAGILRVHDVAECKRALCVVDAIRAANREAAS
ncbi:MAG: dihydropteroate synthase [Bryobacterales bacterium]|nr:dihydropteroate synthase [Bryobacterales bacterium]